MRFVGVCVPRPSALTSTPQPLGRKNISRTNLWIKHILIQDYIYSRLNHYTYSIYSKRYLERPSHGVQNKWKGFSSQYFFFINNKKKCKKTKLHMLPPVCKIKYFDFYFFCLLSNKKYGVWKISNWKINTWKIPTHQILPLRISSGKFSPRKFSPGIFPPMFINIFFHHYHRYH